MKIMSYVFWGVPSSIVFWQVPKFVDQIMTRKKGTVVWLVMFFGGFKLQPEKITTRKKSTVVWPTVEINLR